MSPLGVAGDMAGPCQLFVAVIADRAGRVWWFEFIEALRLA